MEMSYIPLTKVKDTEYLKKGIVNKVSFVADYIVDCEKPHPMNIGYIVGLTKGKEATREMLFDTAKKPGARIAQITVVDGFEGEPNELRDILQDTTKGANYIMNHRCLILRFVNDDVFEEWEKL